MWRGVDFGEDGDKDHEPAQRRAAHRHVHLQVVVEAVAAATAAPREERSGLNQPRKRAYEQDGGGSVTVSDASGGDDVQPGIRGGGRAAAPWAQRVRVARRRDARARAR